MKFGAMVFMFGAWAFVLGLTAWSFVKLLRGAPPDERVPPPGTSL